MRYVEMSIEDAMALCGKSAKVLVAVQSLEDEKSEISFEQKRKEDYEHIFSDIQTVASYMDDFVKQLRCFTAKQDLKNIQPIGIQKIVLLK